jgi:hypothetical protein
MNPSKPSVTVTNLPDLITSIPHLLGFAPTIGDVVIFAMNDHRVVVTVRVDFADALSHTDDILRPIRANNPIDHVFFIHYTTDVSVDALDGVDAIEGIQQTFVAVTQDTYREYGTETAPLGDSSSPLTVTLIAEGVSPTGNRQTKEQALTRDNLNPAVAVALTAEVTETDDLGTEEAIMAYLEGDISLPGPQILALWLRSFTQSTVREPLLYRVCDLGKEKAAYNQLLPLIQQGPCEPATAGAWALCAALAWLSGDGMSGATLAIKADATRSGSVLAGLVKQACEHGLHPEVFRQMILDMSLADLRSPKAAN